MGSPASRQAEDLAVLDDGRGDVLYVAWTAYTGYIQRWNRTDWETEEGGVDSAVYDLLAVSEAGGGLPSLFLGGTFDVRAMALPIAWPMAPGCEQTPPSIAVASRGLPPSGPRWQAQPRWPGRLPPVATCCGSMTGSCRSLPTAPPLRRAQPQRNGTNTLLTSWPSTRRATQRRCRSERYRQARALGSRWVRRSGRRNAVRPDIELQLADNQAVDPTTVEHRTATGELAAECRGGAHVDCTLRRIWPGGPVTLTATVRDIERQRLARRPASSSSSSKPRPRSRLGRPARRRPAARSSR